MSNKKNNILMILAIVSMAIICILTFGVYAMNKEVYIDNPEFKYFTLTSILTFLNGVPSIHCAIEIIRFAIGNKKGADNNITIKLFKNLEKIFYLQAGITFISVFLIGELEDVGPAAILAVAMFIVFISLTLALLFNIIRNKLIEIKK